MNAQDFIYDEADEVQVHVKARSTGSSSSGKSSFNATGGNAKSFGRRGKSPKQFNGIHRRRTKKIRW